MKNIMKSVLFFLNNVEILQGTLKGSSDLDENIRRDQADLKRSCSEG